MAARHEPHPLRHGAVRDHPELSVPELHPPRHRHGAAAARLSHAAAGKPLARRLLCRHCDPRGLFFRHADPEYDDFAKCRVHARRHDHAHRHKRSAAPRPVLLLLAGAAGGAEKGGPARAGRRRARADRVVRARVRPRRRPLHGLDRADRHARGLRVHPPQPLPAVRRTGRGRIRHRAGAGAGDGPVPRARARRSAGHRRRTGVSVRRQLSDGLAARGHTRTGTDGSGPAAAAGSRLSGGCAQRPHAGGHRRLRRRAARRGRNGRLSRQRRQKRAVGSIQRET